MFHKLFASSPKIRVFFSPGEDCLNEILRQINSAKRQIDICMFTITDDRISRALLSAHRRGVSLRIITDDQKVNAQGSDIQEFKRHGIPVCTDPFEERHMHHKFAVFDATTVLVGSYNWTRSASYQYEDLVSIQDVETARQFLEVFEKLWKEWYSA